MYSLEGYKQNLKGEKFDVLVCHAPNIKNHYIFLKKYGKKYSKFMFVFHGHEVLNINKVYSKPYDYVNETSWIKKGIQEIYDIIKLKIWNIYYKKVAYKSQFMFVSEWMCQEFLKWTKIPFNVIENRYSITYNCVGKQFEEISYDINTSKEYDFITIRAYLDGSKYCIDLVCKLALENPECKFLVIGKGEYFKYNKCPKNLTWIDKHLSHNEIISYMNKASVALMPTRTDAQGLMMCEMATYGIPLITSDIEVCKEVFEGFKNIYMMNNEKELNLKKIKEYLYNNYCNEKNQRYYNSHTSGKEIRILKEMIVCENKN